MADSTLSLTFTELSEEAAWFLGYGRRANAAAGLTTDQAKEVDRYRSAGYRTFLNAFDWSFLKPVKTVTAWKTLNNFKAVAGTVSTVTYAAPNTTVVATANVFFDMMVGKNLVGGSTTTYEILSKTSATTVVVSGDASAETTFSVSGSTITDTSLSGSDTVVTSSATEFASTMVGKSFVGGSGTSYTALSFTSTTVITVEGDATSEATFTVTADGAYRLPADYGGIVGPITFQSGEGYYAPIPIRSEVQIRRLLQGTTSTGRPRQAAIRALTTDGIADQKHDLVVFPIPDANYPLLFQYNVLVDALTTTILSPYGGAGHAETIKAAVLAACEVGIGNRGEKTDDYRQHLQASIMRDRRAHSPEDLGIMYDPSDDGVPFVRRTKLALRDGVSYP